MNGNLVIQRRPLESFRVGEDIVITILAVRGNHVKISIAAPKEMPILRTELIGRPKPDRSDATI